MQGSKVLIILFATLFILIISIFASRMSTFGKDLDEKTEEKTCPYKVTTQRVCETTYNGSVILGRFMDMPPSMICCHTNTEKK